MEKLYWIFWDAMGFPVHYVEYHEEHEAEMWDYWKGMIEDEEYQPEIVEIGREYRTQEQVDNQE